MDVPIITTLVAKILAITEGVLDFFVTVDVEADLTSHCTPEGSLDVSVALTNCGEEFVETVGVIVAGVAEFVGPLLAGLNATEYIS
jgi:hypothetical protein